MYGIGEMDKPEFQAESHQKEKIVEKVYRREEDNSSKTTEEVVREYFSDIPMLVEVSRCESTFRHYLEGGNVLKGLVNGSDIGVMQINEYYHGRRAKELGYDIYTLEGNMAYARYLYKKQGLQPWRASYPCWKAAYYGNELASK